MEERYDSQKFSSATLTVDITDVNDTPPQFEQSEYVATIAEHSAQGTVVAAVSATDRDLVNSCHTNAVAYTAVAVMG